MQFEFYINIIEYVRYQKNTGIGNIRVGFATCTAIVDWSNRNCQLANSGF